MQTIKGLIALLFVAAVVFAIGATNDIKSQARYAAKLRSQSTVNVAGKAMNTTTNLPNQVRWKSPRT